MLLNYLIYPPPLMILSLLSKLILRLVWHAGECSDLKCVRPSGSDFLLEIELKHEVTFCDNTGGGGDGAWSGHDQGQGCGFHVDTDMPGLQSHIQLFSRLHICHWLLITDFQSEVFVFEIFIV